MNKIDHDLFLRDRTDISDQQRVEEYCKVFREHVYATRDDSWNEFEKLITGVLNTKVGYDVVTERIGINDTSLHQLLELDEDRCPAITDELMNTVSDTLKKATQAVFDALKESPVGEVESDEVIGSMAYGLLLMAIGNPLNGNKG